MARPVMLSNGRMMVGLNESGLVHDFYFPGVGQENLTNARSLQHLIGVWVDGQFSWLDSGDWELKVDFESTALVSKISAVHHSFQLRLELSDFVDSEYTAFCRQIKLHNLSDQHKEARIFMHQVFQISRRARADTALFVPDKNYLYDYKGRCALLISGRDAQSRPFDQFAIGNFGIEGKEGTFKDAEDGELGGNLVEHGSVDSVIRNVFHLPPNGSDRLDYWIVAAFSQLDAEAIHEKLIQDGLHARLDATRDYWRDWLGVAAPAIGRVAHDRQAIFTKSMMLIKAHIDERGGIIASGDSSIYNYGRDYYSYVWPRDGALTMTTLIRLGFSHEPRRFFEFCIDTINPKGYMMHKYQVDRSIGSTWHPLMHGHHPELAIQEDETALVICALYDYLIKFPDDKFRQFAYDNLILPAANFMADFIDQATNLPHASYDLWEERFGTHAFTTVVTKVALERAAEIAKQLGKTETAAHWQTAAQRITGALNQLYNPQLSRYRRSQFLSQGDQIEYDDTADSSTLYAFVEFDPPALNSEEVINTAKATEEILLDSCPAGGVVRYEHDNYFLTNKQFLGNPWIICTLWLAQYYLKSGQKDRADELINWAISTALPSGVLAEQVDHQDKHQVGVAPLVWSHAELINTLLAFYAQD